jgi:hypothetical protein
MYIINGVREMTRRKKMEEIWFKTCGNRFFTVFEFLKNKRTKTGTTMDWFKNCPAVRFQLVPVWSGSPVLPGSADQTSKL